MNHLSKFTLVFLFGTVGLFAQPMPSDPDWRMLQHDIYHTGLSPLQGDMDTCYVMWACTLTDSSFQEGAPISIGDVDGDDILEVVILGEHRPYDGLYVINGNNGSVQWSDTSYEGWCTPLIEDINGDGTREIIFHRDFDSTLSALNGEDGSILWEYTTAAGGYDHAFSPVCGDIDGDGKLEVVFGLFYDGKIYAIEGENGSFKWSYTAGGDVGIPALGDVDSDGKLEVVGNSDSTVYALNGEDGSLLWSYETNGMSEAFFSLGDIDNDDSLEVVFGSGDNKVCALEGGDGSFKWAYTMSNVLGDLSAPAIGDIEGDGTLEIVVRSEADTIYALNGEDGSFIWSCEAGNFNNSGLVLGDVDGDGRLEAVYQVYGSTAACNGEDGSLLWSFTFPGEVNYSTPALADIDNDGKLEVVFSEDNVVYALNGEESGIEEKISTGLFYLSTADPNPFTYETTVRYELGKAVNIDISVYNMLGQKVKDLFSGDKSSGVHSVSWDGTGESGKILSSGIYFLRIEAGDKEASRKVTLVR